jgi:hypothetical protein
MTGCTGGANARPLIPGCRRGNRAQPQSFVAQPRRFRPRLCLDLELRAGELATDQIPKGRSGPNDDAFSGCVGARVSGSTSRNSSSTPIVDTGDPTEGATSLIRSSIHASKRSFRTQLPTELASPSPGHC